MRPLISVFALLLIAMPVSAQKLQEVRDNVNRDDDRSSNQSNSNRDPAEEESVGAAIANVIFAPFFDAIRGDGQRVRFVNYPYQFESGSNLVFDKNHGGPIAENRPTFIADPALSPWSIRTGVETGSNFDGIFRTGLRFELDHSSQFGFRSNWDYYREELCGGRNDSLWISDLTGTYRFIQSEIFQMHVGLGANLLLDRNTTKGGFNILLSGDLHIAKPLHLFSSFEVGTIGDAGTTRFHTGLGVHWRSIEFLGGYDRRSVGSATLQGVFLGCRLWF